MPPTPHLQRLSAKLFHVARAFGQRHGRLRRLLRPLAMPVLRRLDPYSAAARLAGYRNWAARYDTPTEADRAAIRADIARMTDPPTISVVMPVYNTPPTLLRAAIGSVQAQLYPRWQLCIADDASSAPHVAEILAGAVRTDARIVWTRRARNGHIAAATNTALGLATGAWVALMDHDDLLPEQALYAVAREILHRPDAAIIYTDEDKIDARGRRSDPYFKPDFDPDLLLGQNLISHLGVYRRTLLAEIGGVREGFEGSQDHDLALRAWAACGDAAIRHIPAVLYHWRQNAGNATFSERRLARCIAASRRAVGDVLVARGVGAAIEAAPLAPMHHRIRWKLPEPPPTVSVVLTGPPDPVPLLNGTTYPNVEVLMAGNAAPVADPRIRCLQRSDATPGAWPQGAVAAARGTVLLFLDRALRPLHPDWLHELVAQALRPEIGAVGAKLLGPTGRVSEAGLVLGGDTGAVPFLSGTARRDPGPAGALALVRSVAALSAACLATRRDVFESMGGFDPAAPDPDVAAIRYCLRLRSQGLRVLCTPFAELCWAQGAGIRPYGAEPGTTDDPYYSSNYARAEGNARLAWPPARPAWRTAGSG